MRDISRKKCMVQGWQKRYLTSFLLGISLKKEKKKSIFLFVNLEKNSAFSVNWEPLPNQVEGDQFK